MGQRQSDGWTVDRLAADLAVSGVSPGDVLVVHSSLRSIGYVVGGAAAVVEAFVRAVGPMGTVLFPGLTFEGSMTRFLRATSVIDLAGREHSVRVRGYTTSTPRRFPVIEPRLLAERIMTLGRLGEAELRILDGRRLIETVTEWVRREPHLLGTPAEA